MSAQTATCNTYSYCQHLVLSQHIQPHATPTAKTNLQLLPTGSVNTYTHLLIPAFNTYSYTQHLQLLQTPAFNTYSYTQHLHLLLIPASNTYS